MSLSSLVHKADNTITLINDRKEIVFCSIVDRDSSEAYGKAVAAGGLFLSILGLAAGAAAPAANLLVGLGGLFLSSQSPFHNFHATQSSEIVSRVLFFNDALKWPVHKGKSGVAILFHAQIHGTQVKVTLYEKECSLDINYVEKIIGGDFNEKKDCFTFNINGTHKFAHRRYLAIRGISPGGIISNSTDWKDIPEPGSAIVFDTSGKLLNYYPQKKENYGKDLFEKCTFNFKGDAVIQLVQGESDHISPSLSVLNLTDDKHTPVLKMHGWKCNYLGSKIGNALDNELQKVLDIIRDNKRQLFWGYQWIRDSQKRNYGDVYGLTWPHDGDSISRIPNSELFFVIGDKDWTYTSTIVKG
ncbi:hypothetical protein ACSS6W_010032 [Trichoderma asperelloides]|uniref:Uncharacterized protein n=1 Tax=Trichoderma asperellum TaxID=101201 RepID=A0A6V8QY56_TRIAP|nr:hypothetical protein LI328DRAFT_167863 [Trichoderma asperelloides]GFP57621.1 hypothetical protein TASIC1_0008046200 [Trichoderma asperellum]